MKSVNVQYFALLREEAGIEKEALSTPCETYGDLYCYLQKRYNFSLPIEMIQLAVNDEFTDLDSNIKEESRVVFIPPVAGG